MSKLPPDKYAPRARALGNGNLVDWRTRVLRPYKMLPPIADMMRAFASLFEAAYAATSDGHWLVGVNTLMRAIEAMREPKLEEQRPDEDASVPESYRLDARPGRFAPIPNTPPRKPPARVTPGHSWKFSSELIERAQRRRKP